LGRRSPGEKDKAKMISNTTNRTCLTLAAVFAALAGIALCPASSRADFEFVTGNASNNYTVSAGQAGSVSAEAYFVVGNGTITMYLANLTSGLQAQGQAISGISFTVSAPPNTSLGLTSAAGDVVNVDTNGNFTAANPPYQTFTGSSSPVLATWAASNTPNNVTDVGTPGHIDGNSSPDYMIVGPNASFQSNGTQFNPYFQSTATAPFSSVPGQGQAVVFQLTADGAKSASQISNVTFYFGTGPDGHASGNSPTSVVPVPSSAILLGVGFLGLLGFAGVRRRPKARAAA
jgi:hypothetical protein